jgi:hypothetical protein
MPSPGSMAILFTLQAPFRSFVISIALANTGSSRG